LFFNLSISFFYISFLETLAFEKNRLSTDIDNSSITTYDKENCVGEFPNDDNIDEESLTESTEQSLGGMSLFLFCLPILSLFYQ